MFGSDILDIAIGLVLVYCILSILLTSVCEAIEAVFKTRSRFLELALLQLMQGNQALLDKLYAHPLIYSLYQGDYGDGAAKLAHKLPSYIPRENFAAAVLDLIDKDPKARAVMDHALTGLDKMAGGRPAKLRLAIEDWYDGAMDRAAGWFKRRSQYRLFLIGLILALFGNVNSVTIGQYLAVHPAARDAAVKLAEQAPADRSGNDTQAADASYRTYRSQLDEIGLPIGWSDAGWHRTIADFPAVHAIPSWPALQWLLALIILIAGYLATAFAVMLGAPFWFDILNRLMIIRSTVKPKEKSPDEPPVDGPSQSAQTAAPAAVPES